jgi:hypothetical protein
MFDIQLLHGLKLKNSKIMKKQGRIISKTFLQALSGHLNGFLSAKPSFLGVS